MCIDKQQSPIRQLILTATIPSFKDCKLTTTADHEQVNGQVETYSRTSVVIFLHYVFEHQNDWNKYMQQLTYAHSTQTHRVTEISPFTVIFPSELPSAATFDRWTGPANDMQKRRDTTTYVTLAPPTD